ncbi:MAG TPA: 3-hydroxyacyl-CoA dehydrogenase NAD-binding domain-containing protein [Alphaproteobacteria bacterium]|nr:3-hydroxyacyl-CoA dehydrogenase NAD-binding domain-containing protein [Alphaproteobacteria bacterium]
MAEVHFERHGTIGVITLDNPPVNALGVATLTGLKRCLDEGLKDRGIAAFVLTGAGRMFVGGADIREFGKPRPAEAPTLHQVIETIESADRPFVAAINGVAAGGGLELALGCHGRVAHPKARIGLPEVKLGLLPGAGGTQRLPRLIGVEPALDMIVTGELIPAEKALKLGIVDAVAENVVVDAIAHAERLAASARPPQKVSERDDKIAAAKGKPEIFANYRKETARRFRNFEAPQRCIDCVEAAVTLPFAEGLKKERALFVERVASDQSKAQRHVFFAEREVARIPDVPPETPLRPIGSAAVIGCGTMGGGIAMNFANAGIPVAVLESSRDLLDKGLGIVRRNYEATAAKGRLSETEMKKRLALIKGTTDYDDLKGVDIVIEAVFEEMDIKKEVFRKLDAVCKPAAVLATNTSTLDIDAIAAVTERPESVIGTHFFSPANVMRLLENVRGKKTSKDVIATVMALSKTIGKIGVLVGVCDGFVGNRMLYAYTRQANALILEGALPQEVDKVIFEFGFPMGPFAMNDLAGIDVGWRIRKRRAAEGSENYRGYAVADKLAEMGRFGQKTSAGWYRYEPGSRAPIPDPMVEALILKTSAEMGIERRKIDAREILERCMYPLINEGAKILEEGIALRASDIDIIWINGYGFPSYRGGPMFHADLVGLDNIRDAMRRMHEEHGEILRPAPLLERLASEGKGFADLRSPAG